MDGWLTREAKAIPEPILDIVAMAFNLIEEEKETEENSCYPECFSHIPKAWLRKKGTGDPLDVMGLGLNSVFWATYEHIRYHQLEGLRQTWSHPNVIGARQNRTSDDRIYNFHLQLEAAGEKNQTNYLC